jgi:hypothetical protein
MAEDFTRIGDTFDADFDAFSETTYGRCRRLMKPAARFATTDLGPIPLRPTPLPIAK